MHKLVFQFMEWCFMEWYFNACNGSSIHGLVVQTRWPGQSRVRVFGEAPGAENGAYGAPECTVTNSPEPLLLELRWECLHGLLSRVGGSERLFLALFASHASQDLYWLDRSALPPPSLASIC